jgi:hypothetical protein
MTLREINLRWGSFSQGVIRVLCSGDRSEEGGVPSWNINGVSSKPRDLGSDRGYRVAAIIVARWLCWVRGSIDGIVPTHAAAAPAINFALRSS